MMPTPLDIAFALLFSVLAAAASAFYFDRRFRKQVADGLANARRNAYRRAMIVQWSFAAIALVLWARSGRPWRALGLVPVGSWRSIVGVVVVLLVAAFALQQSIAVRRVRGEGLEQVTRQVAGLEFMLPHDARELRWFLVLSCTAGVCEELLYRGFLTWLLAAYVGLPAAVVLVAVAFGAGHAYQGWKGAIKTGLVSLVMSLIVVASGWLVPAMIVHALVDMSGGVAGFTVLRRPRGEGATAAA